MCASIPSQPNFNMSRRGRRYKSESGYTSALDSPKLNPGGPRMTEAHKSPPAHVGILLLLNGAHVAGAVSCLAQLGIPDLIDSAPKSADDLASQIAADPQALYRLMRATACV